MEGMITEKIVKNIIRRREREIHKGDCGRVLIVAGSRGMAGAAVLCGRAALRAGAGLVRLAIPQETISHHSDQRSGSDLCGAKPSTIRGSCCI